MKPLHIKSNSTRYDVRTLMRYLVQDGKPDPLPLSELQALWFPMSEYLCKELDLICWADESHDRITLCFSDPMGFSMDRDVH